MRKNIGGDNIGRDIGRYIRRDIGINIGGENIWIDIVVRYYMREVLNAKWKELCVMRDILGDMFGDMFWDTFREN